MRGVSEHRDSRVRRLFVSAVVLPIALAVIAGAWFAWQVERISAAADFIDESDRVIALVGDAQRLIVDQEMDLRSFVFTGNPIFLERLRGLEVDEDLDEIEQLVATQPERAEATRALRARYDAWRRHAGELVVAPARGRSAVAMAARNVDVDAIRAKGREITDSEKSTRLTRTRRFERETAVATLGAMTLLALIAGVASLTSRRQLRLVDALITRERDALEKAHEALRAKDAFLTNLSHELRTPLTPILGWVSLARSKPLEGEALSRALSLIERNARAEARIVDDVLDISRIAAGKLRIAPEAVDPAAVVRAAMDVVALSAQAKNITLAAEIDASLPVILGDPARLQQVSWNLLSNAVKFTPRGGRVEIRVERCDGGVRIRVTDDGEGIPADFLPHVFAYFRQADPSMKRAHGGLGLGLAIVKHLVELHGGEVSAESRGPGQGATFTVTLPAAGPHSVSAPPCSNP
jgi:signal transduction histidine kinase